MIPRLQWPLRLAGDGRLAVVEQDSDDDVVQCIHAILLTRVGDRPDVPRMGAADLAFGEQPLELDAVREVLARHEPRATAIVSSTPDALAQLAADVNVDWSRQPHTDPDLET